MPLLNYTTEKDADISAAEIGKMLSRAGASAVMTEYDEQEGYVTSLSFKLKLDQENIVTFRLPCDYHGVQEAIVRYNEGRKNKKKQRRIDDTREQAVRVAWRIVKDWVEAQLAFIESRQVTVTQVFLAYAVDKNNITLYQRIAENPVLLLGDGK